MTYIKIIFLLILAMLERCNLVRKEIVPVERAPQEAGKIRSYSNLTGTWRMEEISQNHASKKRQDDAFPKGALGKEMLSTGVILSLFPDSSFTELRRNGTYKTGMYFISNDSTISFQVNDRIEKVHLSFGKIANDRVVMKLKNTNTNEEHIFAEYAYPLKNYSEDPYHPRNNEWRVKPLTAQSDVAIKRKLANYIQHNCFILRAAIERNQAVVSWEFSDGIIKIYKGGVGTVSRELAPKSWVNAFYSPTEAGKAHELFEQYLKSTKNNASRTANWVKDDYNILMAVYAEAQSEAVRHSKVK